MAVDRRRVPRFCSTATNNGTMVALCALRRQQWRRENAFSYRGAFGATVMAQVTAPGRPISVATAPSAPRKSGRVHKKSGTGKNSGRENSDRRPAPSMDGFHSGHGHTSSGHGWNSGTDGRTPILARKRHPAVAGFLPATDMFSRRGRNSQTGFRPTAGLFPAVGGKSPPGRNRVRPWPDFFRPRADLFRPNRASDGRTDFKIPPA